MFKNKYIIGIVLAILTGFSSCADLDLAPLGSPEAGEISEERQAFLRLTAVYSVMKDFRYTWSMQCFGDVLSNDAPTAVLRTTHKPSRYWRIISIKRIIPRS